MSESPRLNFMTVVRSLQFHHAIGWLLVLVTLYLVGYYVPGGGIVDEAGKPAIGGSSYLIFFFHFPSAVNCLNFFIFGGIVSGWYLARRKVGPKSEQLTASAIEVGVLACTVTLATGSIWAKAAWNVYWEPKDMRLMTVAVTWFTYLGFLVLRANVDDPRKRALFSSIFAVIASINVPIVYFSIKWFGKQSHPMPDADLLAHPKMKLARWFGAFAFLVLYTAFWRWRYRIAKMKDDADRLEASFAEARI
ncbi:MAG: cytochrome c biogenesis protein CcsA [Planctomycetota bacterium]